MVWWVGLFVALGVGRLLWGGFFGGGVEVS